MQPDDKVNFFLDAVRSGLGASPEAARLWIIIVAVIVIVPLTIAFIAGLRARRRRLQAAEHRFHDILLQRGLSAAEQALMVRLERYFQHDKGRIDELAHDPALFDGAARRMQEAEPNAEEALARLRYKLKLILKNAFQAPHSTAELTPGMAVYVTVNGRNDMQAMITDVQDVGFYIATRLTAEPGDEAVFELHSHAGIFRFKTHVKEAAQGFFVLAHTNFVQQTQNRRYLRKSIRLPVRLECLRTKKVVETYALDVSGGGARLYNPCPELEDGDEVMLGFFLGRSDHDVYHARVIRASSRDHSISVAFEKLTEAQRDKFVKLAR